MEGPLEPSIISGATRQEALKFGAQEVRVVGCTDNIWVRLRAPETVRDLLFHRAPEDSLITPLDSTQFKSRVTLAQSRPKRTK